MPIEGTNPRLRRSADGPVVGRPMDKAVGQMVAAMTAALKNSGDAAGEAAVKRHLAHKFGAKAKDEAGFHQLMRTVYGAGYDRAKAEDLRQRALGGDFSWMPPVRFVDDATLQGGSGAYDRRSGVVLLSRDQDLATAAETYVEEAAHHLDTQLKSEDTQGDEGELFRRIMAGEKLSAAQIHAIRSENDKGTITLDGQELEVEFNLWKKIKKGLKKIGNGIANAAKGVWNGISSAVESLGKGTVTFFKGLAEGHLDFFKNLFKGKIGEAFKS
jgi:hypothetical protein